MNKVKILLISLFATAMISTSAFAGSWGMGVSGNLATVAAEGTETTTAGTSSRFTVYRNTSKYVVTVQNGGTSYARGDTIVIPGTSLGGATPANHPP